MVLMLVSCMEQMKTMIYAKRRYPTVYSPAILSYIPLVHALPR